MDKNEILNSLIAVRGTTLCLGQQSGLFQNIESFPIAENINRRILFIPSDTIDRPITTSFHVNGIKWSVVSAPSIHHISRNVAFIPVSELFSDIKNIEDSDKNGQDCTLDNESTFLHYMNALSVYNIWLIDGFPYMSHGFVSELNKIIKLSQKSNLALGIVLITGLHKFGSTDISTESEAVNEALKEINKKNIPVMVIDRSLRFDQITSFYSPRSSIIEKKLQEFDAERKMTKENLAIVKDILGPLMMITVNMSVSEYVKSVKDQLKSFEAMLPVVKYLDNQFFQTFQENIIPIFDKSQDSQLINNSNKCANELYRLLIDWIK
ncbi:MAG: hypothetical protein K2H88_06920 [Duncaniella sp.]|nr:hypothetical protein [Duncaniella sp.]